jgi:hypothetical protein
MARYGSGAVAISCSIRRKKKLAALPGSPSIEAEGEFIQVALQVLVADCTLGGSEKPAFQQRGHAMYPRQKLAGVLRVSA